MLSSWLRAIRIRFLLASVIAVSNGLAIAYWKTGQFDPLYAGLTYAGVAFLHASVDLLNDYWDHKRGIDSATTRTKFSGGTGVLPDKVLTPKAVYSAGVLFLILGALVGIFFVAIRGVTIAVILGFAVVAIYFYSTSIVNSGLGELFVGIKGAMIVLGTFYVQTGVIDAAAIFVGVIVGLLSATVLFVNSFPDFAADRSKGRRTLVILAGKRKAALAFPLFVIAAYALIIAYRCRVKVDGNSGAFSHKHSVWHGVACSRKLAVHNQHHHKRRHHLLHVQASCQGLLWQGGKQGHAGRRLGRCLTPFYFYSKTN